MAALSIDTLACIEHLLHCVAVLPDADAAAAVADFQGDINEPSQLATTADSTPLLVAVMREKPATVAALAARGDLRLAAVHNVLKSRLRIPHGMMATIIKAFRASIDIDAPLCGLGRTALHIAAVHNRKEDARALLEAGANPQVLDVQGNTPSMLAQRAGNARTSTIMRLLEDERYGPCGHIIAD